MTLNFQAGSSPLASRHNPIIYSAIFVGIILIFIAILIWLLLKKIDTLHQTEEWMEKQKDRPTKKSDVIKTARKYNFTDEETNLLWKICHKFKANKAFPEIDKLALMTEKFGVSCDYIILGEDVLEEDKQETKRDVTLSRGLFRTMIFLLSALSVLCAVLATMLVLPIL